MRRHAPLRRHLRGVTLVELMVALTVGLFVVAGYAVLMVRTTSSLTSEGQVRDWQDAQRMAFSTIADTVSIAGYFPATTVASASAGFPGGAGNLLSGTFAAGQVVSGVSGTGTTGDSFAVRYYQDPASTALSVATTDCNGNAVTTGTAATVTNMFTVNSSGQLTCTSSFTAGASALVMVSGVSSMTVLYGVDTGGTGSVGEYQTATQVTAAGSWSNVRTLQITIAFVNPLASVAGQPATLSMTRIVGVQGSL